jgi:hypothetical protein
VEINLIDILGYRILFPKQNTIEKSNNIGSNEKKSNNTETIEKKSNNIVTIEKIQTKKIENKEEKELIKDIKKISITKFQKGKCSTEKSCLKIICDQGKHKGLFWGPSEKITGKLELNLKNEIKNSKIIYIRFIGIQKTLFKNKEEKEFKGINEIYSEKVILFKNDDDEKIPEGTHNFNFAFQLPEKLPTSLNSNLS